MSVGISKDPPRQPPPSEHLWTMAKNGHTFRAQLRESFEPRVELQLLYDGELRIGQLYPTRARALEEAQQRRDDLAQRAWVDIHAAAPAGE